jgi:hypothetical protein
MLISPARQSAITCPTLREIADVFLKAGNEKIEQALKDGTLIEVNYGN